MANPSPYGRRRVLCRTLFLLALLAVPLRVLGFDRHSGQLFLGLGSIPAERLFWPLLLGFGGFIGLLVLSIHRGRIFCSWLCPFHTYLEWTPPGLRAPRRRRALLGPAFALLGAEVVVAFFLSVPDQIHLLRTSPHAPLLATALAVLVLAFLGLLWVYREGFCQQACPYALIQLLLQGSRTATVRFEDPEHRCIHCARCDATCPQQLNARLECSLRHCTNCLRCAAACDTVLGTGRGLFRLAAGAPSLESRSREP